MVKHCIAFGCHNRSSKAECNDLSWHLLPLSNKKLLAEWLVKIRRTNTPVTKHSYVCSQHFEPDCFIRPLGGQRIRLKPGSVPDKFVFTTEKSKRKTPCYRATQSTNQSKKKKIATSLNSLFENIIINPTVESTEFASDTDCGESIDLIESEESSLPERKKDMTHLLEELQTRELELKDKILKLEERLEEEINARKELELLSKKAAFSVETVKNNDKLFRFYTGFENFEVFSMVLDFLGRETASHLDYRNIDRSTSVAGKQYKYRPGPSRTLSVETEFVMVLCRLKVGLLEEDLAARFGVSQSVVSQIINTWIKFMYFRFKELDTFPSKDIVKLHLPECFIKKYSSTTLIIDATEIYMEKPNNLEAQQLTFSSYKNTNTLKAFVGIVPKGGISN